MNRTPTVVKMFDQGLVFTNGAHSAQLDRDFAQQTEALAFRMCGNVKHYSWPMIVYASVSAATTWTELKPPIGSVGFPWQMTPGFTQIGAVVTLLTNVRRPLIVRLRTDDLIDVVAQTSGCQSAQQTPVVRQNDRALMSQLTWHTPGFEEATYHCKITPTLPANNRIAVHVDVIMATWQETALIYLGNLVLMELPDERAGI